MGQIYFIFSRGMSNKISNALNASVLVFALTFLVSTFTADPAFADGWASNTKASNIGSITNTRHNLTMSYLPDPTFMNPSRNDYGEVCVYCHTPHGANSTLPQAPLWNRTNPGNTYTLYNITLTSGQTPTQPGVNSLTCLSCHDGTVAIDSIINMPGSGKYSAAQETSVNDAFLDSAWNNSSGGDTDIHRTMVGNSGDNTSCLYCHSTSGLIPSIPFDIFSIGTDLTDDHPVGVELPDTAVYDFNAPTATAGNIRFYDNNTNSHADSNEVRFYNTGEGYEVECASCHDPHGVPSAGPGSALIPSFLRVNNNNASTLCLTCHVK